MHFQQAGEWNQTGGSSQYFGEQDHIQLFLDENGTTSDIRNVREFNRSNCGVSIWVRTSLCSGTDWLENRFADKELENPFSISQSLSVILSLQERSSTYRAALSMCCHQAKRSNCSALLSLNLNHRVHFWASYFKKGIHILEQLQDNDGPVFYQAAQSYSLHPQRYSLDTQSKITHSCWTCFEARVEVDNCQRSCQT